MGLRWKNQKWDVNDSSVSVRLGDFLNLHELVLTDRVSGMSRFCGRGEGAESKSVLSSDSEQVILSFKQAGNNVGLAGTGSIHLQSINHQLISHKDGVFPLIIHLW